METPLELRTFETGPLLNNLYVAWCADTSEGILIDPASKPGQALAFVREHGIRITTIVYTHAHPDHIPGAGAAVAATGARVAAHPAALKLIRGPVVRALSGFGMFYKPVPPEILLNDGDMLRAGNLEFKVLHTPGHSPDSICLYGHGVVFTGDLLFADGTGRTDIPGASAKALAASLRDKIAPLPPKTLVYPGHGPATTIGKEKATF